MVFHNFLICGQYPSAKKQLRADIKGPATAKFAIWVGKGVATKTVLSVDVEKQGKLKTNDRARKIDARTSPRVDLIGTPLYLEVIRRPASIQCHQHDGEYQDGPDIGQSHPGCNFSKHCPDLRKRVATIVVSTAAPDVYVRSQHFPDGRDSTLANQACQWLSSDLSRGTYPIET
jgi:hypothetical protein